MSLSQKSSLTSVESEALEGDRRSTENASDSTSASFSEPEVSPRKKRRRLTSEYKLRILEELDQCVKPGEKGAILRREGLYTSTITDWRKARNAGALGALDKLRGRKPKHDARDKKIQVLELELSHIQEKLRQAETILDVQKKVCEIFGITSQVGDKSEQNK